MSDLPLALAIGDYVHTRELAAGQIAFCYEQGLTRHKLVVEELFPKEVNAELRI